MRYVVFNKAQDNKIVELTRFKKYYQSMAAAKAAITRASKKYQKLAGSEIRNGRYYEEYQINKDPQFIYGAAEESHYAENLEKHVTRTSRTPGTNEEVTITMSINDVGTCVDPFTETYWSM